MNDDDRLFAAGTPNPDRFGFLSIRSSAGSAPDAEAIAAAASSLGRPVCFVDDAGYECEIIGAATNAAGDIAYVESRAKDVGPHPHGAGQRNIDVSIRVHLRRPGGHHESVDIESYNPFFGCDVRYFGWHESSAVLIYREKHSTYACRLGDIRPPLFVKIEDRWLIKDDVLAYVGYADDSVRRLSFPELDELPTLAASEAAEIGLLPDDSR